MELPFYLLDVFAERKHEGNQLLVVVDEDGALDDAGMLAICREINYAETAFLGSAVVGAEGTEAGVAVEAHVRIFTPEYEVPFAGHPSLGLAHVAARIMEQRAGVMSGSVNRVMLKLATGGKVPVARNSDGSVNSGRTSGNMLPVWWMTQPQPVFLPPFPLAKLAPLLPPGVDEAALEEDGTSVPHVSTGLPYLLIPMRDAAALEALKGVRPGGEEGAAVLAALGLDTASHPLRLCVSLYFYYRAGGSSGAGSDYDGVEFLSRMFCFERGEWVEDAATGSAAGCLAAYLALQQQRQGGVTTGTLRILQGVAMGRPSSLLIEGRPPLPAGGGSEWLIRVGGKIVPIASGLWAV